MLNFLLIYLNLVSLENQNLILEDIRKNQQIGLQNQELAFNISGQNDETLGRIIILEGLTNKTLSNFNLSNLS
jgi:hypothetical protein